MKPIHPDEGKLITRIEEQSSKIPSGVYLSASLAATVASILLKKRGKNIASVIIQWVIPVLMVGLYSKIMKTADRKWKIERE